MSDEPDEREAPYRRRFGVIFRNPGYGPMLWGRRTRRAWINDGGRDAPMGPKDRVFFRDFFWVIVAVIVVLAVIWQLS